MIKIRSKHTTTVSVASFGMVRPGDVLDVTEYQYASFQDDPNWEKVEEKEDGEAETRHSLKVGDKIAVTGFLEPHAEYNGVYNVVSKTSTTTEEKPEEKEKGDEEETPEDTEHEDTEESEL